MLRSPRRLRSRYPEEFDGIHHYLWTWTPVSEVLPKLIYTLKSREMVNFKIELLEKLIVRVPLSQVSADHIVYVTRPGMVYDHTRILAEKLSDLLSCQLNPIYLKNDLKNYKLMNRADRLLSRKAIPLHIEGVHQKKVLFIDDVYTSGATAKAAWEALGKPKDYGALTLAFKRYEGD
ncbi:MAG: hypothetical protein K2Q26_01340 [Bdellovibrionales bacterium]|nr:hypothetical protein [Bdellovibrionales bacterium]